MEIVGVAVSVAIVACAFAAYFLCYYVATRLVIAKAGLPAMPFRYYIQGFLGMALAIALTAILTNVAIEGWFR